MAYEANIAAGDHFFYGEDKTIKYAVYDADGVTPIDVASWALAWTVRKTDKSATVVLSKTIGAGIAIEGTFNVDPNVNTQRVVVTLSDTDTLLLRPKSDGTAYRHSLKRTDDNNETVLAFGDLDVSIATSW